MAITYNIKADARGYDPRGVTDWGLASRHLDSLSVTLGAQFQSSRGLMAHVTAPLWDGTKDFTVRVADLIQVVVEDQPPTTPPMPPPEVAFRWRDAAGNIIIEQVYIKKPV